MDKKPNKKTEKDKDNKYIIIGSIFILFVFTLIIVLMSNTYALDDFGSISISCNKDKVIKDDLVSCTLTGNVIEERQISSLEMQINLSTNLELISFLKDSSWEGDGENGNIQLYTENDKEGTFAIGVIQAKVKNTVYNIKENINLKNIVFYQGEGNDFAGISINDTSKELDTPTVVFNSINVDDEKKAVYKISLATTSKQLLDNITVNGTKTIKNKKNQTLSSGDILKTGDVLTINVDNETIEYKVSVLGDTTGDGELLINDIGKAYQYIKGRLNISEECILAAEVTKDGEVQVNDIGKMYQYLKGRLNSLG